MNKQSRKYQLTINNPQEHGLDHEAIKDRLKQLTACSYYCMADEIGLEKQTPHTHIFISLRNSTRFSTIKRLFPEAHIEAGKGTAQQNKAYLEKSGKWVDDPKADTSVPGTFEESGPLPEEPGQGYRSDIAELYSKIEEGMSNAEIMAANPDLAAHIGKMDKIRQDILEARYRETWRDLDVTYIFGPTATGKTRGVMEKHGYGNIYRVTDYSHAFDRYAQEPVLCLDEYRSSLQIGKSAGGEKTGDAYAGLHPLD